MAANDRPGEANPGTGGRGTREQTLVVLEGGRAIGPAPAGKPSPITTFERRELMQILSVYGRKVAAGEWRDYAMDFLKDRAVFSIYARVSERPLFIVEKIPRLRARQGQFMVTNQAGRILKRGHELSNVLGVLETRLALVD